jgi:hypothetical protein
MQKPTVVITWRVTPEELDELAQLEQAIGVKSRAQALRRAVRNLAVAHELNIFQRKPSRRGRPRKAA